MGYQGQLVLPYATLIQGLWKKDAVTVPREFRHVIGQLEEDFGGDDMQDAYDFLNFMVDGLHEDTNLRMQAAKKEDDEEEEEEEADEQQEYEHDDDDEDFEITDLALEQWSKTLKRDWSFIFFMFYGQMASTIEC